MRRSDKLPLDARSTSARCHCWRLITPSLAAAAASALGCPHDLLPGIGHALLPEAPQAIADVLAALTR